MRLCSSRQMVAALIRLGCYPCRAASGSHQFFARQLPDGSTASAPVVLGKRQIKRGTARSTLRLLQISEDDFDRALR